MRRSILSVVVCGCVLVGCGDGIDPESAATTSDAAADVTTTGTDELLWRPAQLSAPAGPVEVTVECGLNVGHELAIEGVPDAEPLVACERGMTANAEVELEAGTYTFYCAVPGHREEGMEGELVIE